MRLNLGCGKHPKTEVGWENMDAVAGPNIDIVGDIRHIPRPDGYYSEVYSHWVLEHFSRLTIHDFLAECYRVLSKGGVFNAVTSNGEAINKGLLEGKLSWELWNYLTFTDGPSLESHHKIGFSESYARELLEKAKFINIKIETQWDCMNSSGELTCPALIITANK